MWCCSHIAGDVTGVIDNNPIIEIEEPDTGNTVDLI
jgi:hypothetical protein